MMQMEDRRVAAVNRYLKLKISKERELNDIVKLAAKVCDAPTAHVTFIGDEMQYVKFALDVKLEGASPRSTSFCTHTIKRNEILIVPDTRKDERFWDHPAVLQEPAVRFYAGSPLTTNDGYNIGSLCIIDHKPGNLSDTQVEILNTLSRQVVAIFELEAMLNVLNEQYNDTKASEVKIKAFFESSLACHLLLDRDLKVVYFNKTFAQYVDRLYKHSLAVGMSFTNFVPAPYIEDFILNCNLALAGVPVQSEREIEFEQETIGLHITYEPAYNEQGEIIGISYNTMDVTAKIEQQKKISQQNKSLRAIAQIQSHDLRSPVASMIGLFDVWRSENYAHNPEIIGMMEAAIHNIDKTIHQIIDHTPL
jgi:PAS domain S-box-containing protein